MTGEILLITIILLPMLAAIIVYSIGSKNIHALNTLVLSTAILCFALFFFLAIFFFGTELYLEGFAELHLHLRIDGFRLIYGFITTFIWLVTTIFSREYFANSTKQNRYWLFNLFTIGTTMGFFFSADFFTAFLFFELISLSSYGMVAHDESPAALRAAETFLAIAIISGLSILMGLLLLWQSCGTLEFSALYEICMALQDKSRLYPPGALLLLGFGAKAGMYPLHIWLPKAHPVAPAPASALLSGLLTKTGIFGVVLVSCYIFPNDYRWGITLLSFAVITMLLGSVLAVFSDDLKRILACSSISQIGFILSGVAMCCLFGGYNDFAVSGTLLHMLNHSLVKLILFILAGVVYMNCHELKLDEIRGFGRKKPLFLVVFIIGAFALSGLPFSSGFISKTLLHEGIIEGIHIYNASRQNGIRPAILLHLSEAAFYFAGALTIIYMAKIFVALLIKKGKEAETNKRYLSFPSAIALSASALLLLFLGCPAAAESIAAFGQGFFHGRSPEEAVHYFTWPNFKSVIISISISAIIYFLQKILKMTCTRAGLGRTITSKIHVPDLENLVYRPFASFIVQAAGIFFRYASSLPDAIVLLALRTVLRSAEKPYTPGKFLSRHYWLFFQHLEQTKEKNSIIGSFSFGLLLTGLGISIMLLFMFLKALNLL